MTERELIAKQEAGNNKTLFLMKVGMFFHAYEAGAFALARLMHYRVKRKARKGGQQVLVAGFPVERLPVVAERIKAAGGKVLTLTDTWVEFAGPDCTADAALVDGPKTVAVDKSQTATERKADGWKQRILNYDLSQSTPLQAMNFLADVQTELKSHSTN